MMMMMTMMMMTIVDVNYWCGMWIFNPYVAYTCIQRKMNTYCAFNVINAL